MKYKYEPGVLKVLFPVYKIEFEEEDSLFDSGRDVTINIEENVKAEKQKSADDFTPADDDDNPLSGDDKTEV